MTTMFVYGTLKRGYGNNRLLEDCEFLGEAVSARAEFSLTKTDVPFLAKGEQKVKGELWEVDADSLNRIDALEGHPDGYCREQRNFVKECGEEVIAWVYLADRYARNYSSKFKYEGEVVEWSRP